MSMSDLAELGEAGSQRLRARPTLRRREPRPARVTGDIGSTDRVVAVATGGAVVVAVGFIYGAMVVLPHIVLDRSGEIGSGFVLPLAATATVALLLAPLRRAASRAAHRVVRGHSAEPYQVLSQLTSTLSPAGAGGDVELVEMLGRGTGANSATIWVHSAHDDDDDMQPVEHWPLDQPVTRGTPGEVLDDAEMAWQPIVHRGEELGAVTITKTGANGVGVAERQILVDVAAGLALTLRNHQLVAELEDRASQVRASRARLIEAHDHERRHLERDLHDGAQQHLIALRVKLGLAASMAEREEQPVLAATIHDLVMTAQEAVGALRDVAHGIYPPLLESKGLASALHGVAGSARAAVAIDVQTADRFDRPTEETVYFAVVELVHRAVEAGATDISVSLRSDRSTVVVHVAHDGDEANLGSGTTMDRVSTADGSMRTSIAGGRAMTEIELRATRREIAS